MGIFGTIRSNFQGTVNDVLKAPQKAAADPAGALFWGMENLPIIGTVTSCSELIDDAISHEAATQHAAACGIGIFTEGAIPASGYLTKKVVGKATASAIEAETGRLAANVAERDLAAATLTQAEKVTMNIAARQAAEGLARQETKVEVISQMEKDAQAALVKGGFSKAAKQIAVEETATALGRKKLAAKVLAGRASLGVQATLMGVGLGAYAKVVDQDGNPKPQGGIPPTPDGPVPYADYIAANPDGDAGSWPDDQTEAVLVLGALVVMLLIATQL
tara:strand:- start:4369 stop:5196 length:828 start_codon:yes stop_codon:yes gene_type:complete